MLEPCGNAASGEQLHLTCGCQAVSDRAGGDCQWVARGHRADREAAGRNAGGTLWREVFAGAALRSRREEGGSAGCPANGQAAASRARQRLESELRSKAGAENLAGGAGTRSHTWGGAIKWPPPP